MSTSEFFPFYPSPRDSNFQEKINKKMEFIELIPDEYHKVNGDVVLPNKYYLHQELIKRFVDRPTPYGRLIVNHETGVGKTKVAVCVYEHYKSFYKVPMIFAFFKNDNHANNFKREVLHLSSKKKSDSAYKNMTQRGANISCTKAVAGECTIATIQTFFTNSDDVKKVTVIQKRISLLMKTESLTSKEAEQRLSEEERDILQNVRAVYDNTVLIFDEIHSIGVVEFDPCYEKEQFKKDDRKLSGLADEPQFQYRRIWSLLQTASNAKVILLTATVMVDNSLKMVSMLNLILPRDQQISYEEAKEVIKTNDQKQIDAFFAPYMRGRISFVKKSSTVANTIPQGICISVPIHHDKHTKQVTLKVGIMEDAHAIQYLRVMTGIRKCNTKTTESNSFGHEERQASNFVLYMENEHPKLVFNNQQLKETYDIDLDHPDRQKFTFAPTPVLKEVLFIPNQPTYFQVKFVKFYSNEAAFSSFETFTNLETLPRNQVRFFLKAFGLTESQLDLFRYETEKPNLVKKFTELTILQKAIMRPDLAVANIRKSGVKIANVIEDILVNLQQPEEKQECMFIYSHYKPFGAYVIAGCLTALGFAKFSKDQPHNKATFSNGVSYCFATLTDAGDKPDHILDIFNRHDNKNGTTLKLVIGSEKSAESISFQNVRAVHILEPSWNDTDTIQAFGRAIRANSHSFFEPHERYVRSFIHVAAIKRPDNKIVYNEAFIDFFMTHKTEKKAFSIDQIQQSIKKFAIDRIFNAWRNGDALAPDYKHIDYSTYRVFYKNNFVDLILQKLQLIFHHTSSINFSAACEMIEIPHEDVLYVIETICQYKLNNQFGMEQYVQYDGENLFLLPNKLNMGLQMEYYSHVKSLSSNLNIQRFLEQEGTWDNYIAATEKLLESFPADNLISNIRHMAYKDKLTLLESILIKYNRTVKQEKFLEFMQYRWFIIQIKDKQYYTHILYYNPEINHFTSGSYNFKVAGKNLIRIFDGTWRHVVKSEEAIIIPIVNKKLDKLRSYYINKNNQFFGMICTTHGLFKFIDLRNTIPSKDKRKKKRGVTFKQIDPKQVLDILHSFWVDLVKTFDDNDYKLYFNGGKNISWNDVFYDGYFAETRITECQPNKDKFIEDVNEKLMRSEVPKKITNIIEHYCNKKDLTWTY